MRMECGGTAHRSAGHIIVHNHQRHLARRGNGDLYETTGDEAQWNVEIRAVIRSWQSTLGSSGDLPTFTKSRRSRKV